MPYFFTRASIKPLLRFKQSVFLPNFYDMLAFVFIMSLLALITIGTHGMNQTLVTLKTTPIELSLWNLPKYALYSTLRLFVAIILSLIFSFIVATLASKNKKAEMIIIPILDILQSVPILGFLTFTVSFFMGLLPQQQLGVELAAIFVIFTSQAWNMTFSLYYSLKTVPKDLEEICEQFSLNGWQRFWRLEIPFAMPGLVWNTVMSMSGGWFFIVASEAVAVGNTKIALPGIGSWLALAIDHQDLIAVGWAIFAMAIIILLCDQFIFRPIIVWADSFKMGDRLNEPMPTSWFYSLINQSKMTRKLINPLSVLKNKILYIQGFKSLGQEKTQNKSFGGSRIFNILWAFCLVSLLVFCLLFLFRYLHSSITFQIMLHVLFLGSLTALRVFILIVLFSLIWVPIGIYIGLRPGLTTWVQPLAQFLAAFPANVLFPIFVIVIVKYDLNTNVWLSPLMILGAQWYIFFNVIAGASVFPHELKEVCTLYKVRSLLWFRKIILPAILPYYITGALTAAGGAWNASIVAEVIHWGSKTLSADGLGAFIAIATTQGDTHAVVLGVAVMCLFVVISNRLIWNKLYEYATKYMA